MSANKMEDRPPAVLVGDLVSGAYCALGVLEALYSREKTGKGQLVDVSMQDVVYNNHFQAFTDRALEAVKTEVTSLIGMSITNLLTDDKKRLPFWNSFKARDGYVAIVAITDKQWNSLVEALDVKRARGNDRLSNIIDRIKNSEEGLVMVSEAVARLTVAEVNEGQRSVRNGTGS
jgi:CoA:oxalate CoA-transferase